MSVNDAVDKVVARHDESKTSREIKLKRKVCVPAALPPEAVVESTVKREQWVSKKRVKIATTRRVITEDVKAIGRGERSRNTTTIVNTLVPDLPPVTKNRIVKMIDKRLPATTTDIVVLEAITKVRAECAKPACCITVLKDLEVSDPLTYNIRAPTIAVKAVRKTVTTRVGVVGEAEEVKTWCESKRATNQKSLHATITVFDSTNRKHGIVLFGRVDGLTDDGRVEEVKTRKNKKWRRLWPNELAQLHGYMYMNGKQTSAEFVELHGTDKTYRYTKTIEFDEKLWEHRILPALGVAVGMIRDRLDGVESANTFAVDADDDDNELTIPVRNEVIVID
jgi:hypothetical protein